MLFVCLFGLSWQQLTNIEALFIAGFAKDILIIVRLFHFIVILAVESVTKFDLKIIFLKLEASSTYVLMTNKIISIIVTFSGNMFFLVTEELIPE